MCVYVNLNVPNLSSSLHREKHPVAPRRTLQPAVKLSNTSSSVSWKLVHIIQSNRVKAYNYTKHMIKNKFFYLNIDSKSELDRTDLLNLNSCSGSE